MNNGQLIQNLVDKSIEAFLLGLEIYNKPTIRYRIEGFSFFICNAWELMLKAELIFRNTNIYYKDNPERTINLSETVSKIYPDKNTRVRRNLEQIIELRNISTHFITEDYEVKYAPLFQACVLNFTNELHRFHMRDITDIVPQNFLTVSAYLDPLTNEEIRLKYPPEIAEKLINQGNQVDVLTKEFNSDKFAINIRQNLYITKKKDEADFTVRIEKGADTPVEIVKDIRDPANTHKYAFTNVVTAVQERMQKLNLKIDNAKGFTSNVLSMFIEFYNIKQDTEYSYRHKIGNTHHYTYSEKLVDFIMGRIKEDMNSFVTSLKKSKK